LPFGLKGHAVQGKNSKVNQPVYMVQNGHFGSKHHGRSNDLFILWRKFRYFPILKSPKKHGQRNFLHNFQKESSHFNKKNYEMAKVLKGFG
jgi:hypothetical protein